MEQKITKIEFNQTSNIFINTGIVGLYRYLQKFKRKRGDEFEFEFKLSDNSLVVESKKLFPLLEEVYYFMGKDLYDLSSKKQLDKMENVYYDEKEDKFHRFPKMNTYGFASLLTNNAQGTTKIEKNSPKIEKLDAENPKLAGKIRGYFERSNLKLLKKVYLNEPYKKTTTINIESKFWEVGNFSCPLIGEKFKKLENGINISPFIKGLNNFNSFLDSTDIKISQKALYLLRFSPVLSMYTYFNGYDSFVSTFFNSNSLSNINKLNKTDFFYPNEVMREWKMPFKRNIKLQNFTYARKGKEDYTIETGDDSFSPQEITFLILFTFYKNKLIDELNDEDLDQDEGILSLLEIEKQPLSLVTFKADKFSTTLRPNFYEEFTNAKYIIQLIHKLETNEEKRVPIKEIWRGLVVQTSQSSVIKDYNKRLKQERQIRIEVIDYILNGKSIINSITNLFHKSFLRLATNENPGYRRYDLVLELLKIYESTLNIMDKNLQLRAIGLGKSIGYAILNYEDPKTENEKRANAKNGRKYLIGLHKARTIEQFRDTLIRIQNKYGVSVANEILENLSEKNYLAIKQYAQIGALNSLNTVLSNQNSKQNENK